MRRIEKGAEPQCLQELRQTPGADWSSASGTDKQAMREHAWTEQRGLCAYCMSRLPPPSAEGMKIEHFMPRAMDRTLWFTWSNLLGVCLGDLGLENQVARFHCDTYRGHLSSGEQGLRLHPAQFPPDVGTCFSYTNTGEIRPARHLNETEGTWAEEAIQKLNLNIDRLKRNRAAVRDRARQKLMQGGPVTRRHIEAMLANARRTDGSGCLMEYVEVAIQYLEKKRRQVPK